MYEIFVQLCKEKGVSTYKVCKDLGISQGTISNWKNRGNNLNSSTLQKLASYFGVSIEYLLGSDQIEKKDEEWDYKDNYYIDDTSRDLAQFLFENPEHKVLFDASRKVKPEDIQKIVQMMKIITGQDD